MKPLMHLKATTTAAGSSQVLKTTNGTVVTGIDIKLLELLAERMNFRYTMVLPTDNGRYGMLYGNGSWSGVSGMLQRGEADISTLYSPVIEERLPILDFSIPLLHPRKDFCHRHSHSSSKVHSSAAALST
ncbi:lig_chan-Glu_bd domain-containing protein [Caerostris darwini]|uniref:Lig_chan-Glu_bd domain-containing protein n=1 Tax=Caerostris darwini TaxID=1538125 RepID=A0AAV4QUC6_9ARAC|nr:lig_chan-Glu_bd domain-containing protein [Caerostris darwini]